MERGNLPSPTSRPCAGAIALWTGVLTAYAGVITGAGLALAASQTPGGDPGAWDLAPPAPVAGPHTERLEAADALDCRRCHADVVEEWSRSLHALAWIDPPYQEELAGLRRPQGCHGCHVPVPLFADGLDAPALRPEPRPDAADAPRVHGVDCAACHLGPGGEMLGPHGRENEGHASLRSEHFVGAGSNALCSACHSTNIGPVIGVAKDFDATGQAARGRSCVGCHMAPVERAPGADGEPRTGRSHALQTPRDPTFLRRAFALSIERRDGGVGVLLENRCGHRVPGLIGRRITWRARLVDGEGAVLDEAELAIDHRAHLPADGALALRLSGEGAAVHVVGVHADPRLGREVTFADERLEIAAGSR